jgi:membrane-associated protein
MWPRASKKARYASRISSDRIGDEDRLALVLAAVVLASIINIPSNIGYAATFGLIAIETMGVPVPGEAALIASSLAAHDGQLDIGVLVALAATAAILGDNVGFLIGRRYGRTVFEKPGPLHRQRLALLDMGQPFFAKHGPKAVFLGRWVSGLRIASAWLAGMNHMAWPTFLFWNALGGIFWACAVGFGAYFAGHAFEKVIGAVGIYAAGAFVVVVVGFLYWRHRKHKRELEERGAELQAQLDDDAVPHHDVA